MVVLYILDSDFILAGHLNDEPVIASESHRILPGTVTSQGMQPQSPVSKELGKFVRCSQDCQPLDIFPAYWDAEEPGGL